jgi:hypothetical protein
MVAQRLYGVDRVVVGDGYQIHPAPLQRFVDWLRIAIALAANPVEQRHGTHARVPRMDVQVASHTSFLAGFVFQLRDVLKTFLRKIV